MDFEICKSLIINAGSRLSASVGGKQMQILVNFYQVLATCI